MSSSEVEARGRATSHGTNSEEDIAVKVARQTLARRNTDLYANEVRRLLDAAMGEIRARGTGSRPRVADIVAAAGLSNDAFYRHFRSKDELVTALLEEGANRLQSYLAHQMSKETTPKGQIRQWVQGILAQADEEIAETTLAVLYNSSGTNDERVAGRHFASAPLAHLLYEPLRDLGSTRPEIDASFVAHATLGTLSDHLWNHSRPPPPEIEHLVRLCLGVAGTSTGANGPARN